MRLDEITCCDRGPTGGQACADRLPAIGGLVKSEHDALTAPMARKRKLVGRKSGH